MSKNHNKKRNVGLLHEFIARYISDRLIEGDDESIDKALRILRRNFKKSSEIYKEFRLFRSLMNTTVRSENVAYSILSEAKSLSRKLNTKNLDREKSLLIRDINHDLGPEVYNRRIPEYRTYATIHTLLEDWRSTSSPDLIRIAKFEDSLIEWLQSDKEASVLEEIKDPQVDDLVLRIMTEKINQKYGSTLNEEQISILRSYAFDDDSSRGILRKTLEKISDRTIRAIEEYTEENPDDTILNEKLENVVKNIGDLDLENIDDVTIERFLEISSMRQEILGDYYETSN